MSSLGLGLGFLDLDSEDVSDLPDWKLPLCFHKSRHKLPIEGNKTVTHTWRMKERMKTVSVALVLCLNVGVDPPDVIKTQPCARLECWTDPLSMTAQKALETIGANLQKQYERWQPRARYKQSLDPTTEEVKKLCTSLRRNAKDERVLFHYNGHGVPKPTTNGEIWVFNRSYTQYIPLSLYDLQTWMGVPSIFVFDCSNAGLILDTFYQFAAQHDREYETILGLSTQSNPSTLSTPDFKECVQLAACRSEQQLPMNPDLPADLFTACLTTPIKVALRCRFIMQSTSKLVPGITLELIDKIPGQLNDRRTMLGELNWIFTAITDTIAWNVLSKDLFQKLFRQDLLVASLFRNFLLAERIMRSYNCNPLSVPRLPSTNHHPMWQAWDLAVDICLSQLPGILSEGATFRHSPFFAEQLTAFQVWLTFGSENHNPPEQLPIVLQVLLSQVHRLRALELLGRFLDLGPWAVNLALSVGIFPYVLKLLQSSARELRPLLVFIWAKVLAVDSTCQTDLVRDGGHKYFLNVLLDQYIPSEHRTMAAFVMARIARDYRPGQEAAMQGNVVSSCLEQISDSNPLLRQWLAICLGKTWHNYDAARWCGARDSAHEKLYVLLADPVPEVRGAAVYALGTFINSAAERTDHANTMDHSIGMTLINAVAQDGSPIVRMELVIALQWLVLLFENQFVAVAYQYLEEEKLRESVQATNATTGSHYATQDSVFLNPSLGTKKVASRDKLKLAMSSSPNTQSSLEISSMANETMPVNLGADRMRRVCSNVSLSTISTTPAVSVAYASVYTHFWRALVALGLDPYPSVATMAKTIIKVVKSKISTPASLYSSNYESPKALKVSSYSEPSSPSGKASFLVRSDSPPANMSDGIKLSNRYNDETKTPGTPGLPHHVTYPYSAQFSRTRKLFDKGPSVIAEEETEGNSQKTALVETEFIDWCSKYFSQPVYKFQEEADPESSNHQEKEWRYMRNAWIRKGVHEEQKRIEDLYRLDDQVFISKNPSRPSAVKFHPYESTLVVTNKDSFSVWDWERATMPLHRSNNNVLGTRISSMDFINPHDATLLLTGTDDGAVRIWRNCFGDNAIKRNTELVTAFQALPDMVPTPRGSGLVLHWEQHATQLAASGEIRNIRLWDLEKERKIQDIPTGAESCVTSLSSNSTNPSLLVAGCGDGSIRVFDRRLTPHECRIMTMREHMTWVITVCYQSEGTLEGSGKGTIYSGSVSGDVKFWDIRQSSSLQTIHTAQGMTAMAIHPNINILACGSVNQCISIYNSKNGQGVNLIKYHDGFMGQRIGPISCLSFHPYRASLAAGTTDSFVSIYSVDRRH